jgi:hypothetical protein
MDEKAVQNELVNKLRACQDLPDLLSNISLSQSTSNAATLYDLIGDLRFELFPDTSDWNQTPRLMGEIIGGMTPDVVLRSVATDENRIIIEVKLNQRLNYGVPDSQIVRYFLHLLALTESRRGMDIRRAVLVAAPAEWFGRV